MYFETSCIVGIESLITKKYNFYAHRNDNEDSIIMEPLTDHSNLAVAYFMKLINAEDISQVFERFEKYFFEVTGKETLKLFRKMVINTISFHDIGKINPVFQLNKMNNNLNTKDKASFLQLSSHHSIISAALYINYFYDDVMSLSSEDKKLMKRILMVNSYVISRHHSDLNSFEEFLNMFKSDGMISRINDIFCDSNELIANEYTLTDKKCMILSKNKSSLQEDKSIYLYTYCRLLYSILVACDYYATSCFMEHVEIRSFGDIKDINEILSIYNETALIKKIRKYQQGQYGTNSKKSINDMRSELFLDSEEMLLKALNNAIYFLEAPTGSGKSNTALNLSLQLIKHFNYIHKIFNVYPYNTLVEQNLKCYEKVFGEHSRVMDKIAVVNSLYPIKTDKEEEYYSKALLDRQFLNYPIILTTHVSVFNSMFGSSKESAFGFHQLANSVIILDEIQSYRNIIWSEIITFLAGFSKILNCKFIIMSATLPDLKLLIPDNNEKLKSSIVNLITDREKYFSNPVFQNRVEVNYELLKSQNIIEDLKDHILNQGSKKILVEFIKKKSAYDFYYCLKDRINSENRNIEIELLTGDDNMAERSRVINKITSGDCDPNGIILISTQIIEAGVDIDMDIGYKDISKLDSEEQFMGRINRSCNRKGVVYFFNFDNEISIYNDDLRINKELTLINDDMKDILIGKCFSKFYSIVLNFLRKDFNEAWNDDNLETFFKESVGKLNMPAIEKRMELIKEDEWSMSVFLSRDIEIIIDNKSEKLSGDEVWKTYKALLKNKSIGYAERQVKLSQIRSRMNYFIYTIKRNINLPYNDKLGELYYIENGEDYFEEGKLNKEKFTTNVGIFLDI